MMRISKRLRRSATVMAAMCAVAAMAYTGLANRYELRSPGGNVPGMSRRADQPKPATQTETGKILYTGNPAKVTAPGAMPLQKRSATQGDSPSLIGLMIYSSSQSLQNAPGVYAIDANTGTPTLMCPFAEAGGSGSIAGTCVDGVLYASYCDEFYGNISSLVNYQVELSTGKVTSHTYEAPTCDDASVNMTYDASTRTIYSINYSGTFDYYALTTFDPSTNSYTEIGDLQEHYYAICSDSQGHLYAINDLGAVVEIDPATGYQTGIVAQTNIEPSYSQSCTWSPKDNKIYWAACNARTAALITIDPATGEVATATLFPHDEEYVALSCTDPAENRDAPAAPAALSVSYPSAGGNVAEISCILPTHTVGGGALEGNIEVEIHVDGNIAATDNGNPGAHYSTSLTLETGVHRVEALCRNSAGNGSRSRVTTFTGTDAPAAISDLRAETEGSSTVRLTWSTPSSGEHGGWFDESLLTFNVVRDGVCIARNLTDCNYTDTPEEDTFANRTYHVETCYDGTVCSVSNVARATTGDHLALPYHNDFESENAFDLLTVLDLNGDGVTWFLDDEYNTASYNFSRTEAADELLVMPMIKGEKGHVYRLEFFTRAASGYYPDKLEVVCGTEPTESGLGTVLMEGRAISNEGENLSMEYAPETDGPLYFAFHCVSDKDMSRLFVDDVTISDGGRLADPAPVTNLTAEASQDGSLSVKLSFTAPSATLAGEPLTTIDAIEIYRNGTLIDTLKGVAPGSNQSYTDNHAEFGFNTYAVVAKAAGEGVNRAETRVFAGIYTLPFEITPTPDEYTLFTIPGGEGDNTWYHDSGENALKVTTYSYSGTDAYIFTPAIELTDANLVELTFNYRAGISACTEELEVTFGTSPDPSTHNVVDRFQFNNTEYAPRRVSFPVASAGRYYIGMHAVSEPGQMMMLVRDIRLDRGSLMTAPAPVDNMEVKGNGDSSLTANVSFTLPSKTLDGSALSGTLGARLYREDGTLAASGEGFAPGACITLTDTEAHAGINTYTVTATNTNGEGGRAEASGWIGVDVPGHISFLEAVPSYDNLRAELEWGAPTESLHGGWFDPEALTYKVYQLVDNSLYLIATTDKCEITVTPEGVGQDFHTFYVTATTEAGESQAMSTGLVIGAPYELPMIETASNKIVTALPWISGPLEGDVNWGVADYIGSLDVAAADGGMFVCSAALPERRPGAARMQLPKLVFNGLNAPTLTFKMYRYAIAGAELEVSVTTDELEYRKVFSTNVTTNREGWVTYSVNLAEYADAPWVAIVFDGILTNGAGYVIVDDIEVSNQSEHDLLINRVTGKLSPEAGMSHNYEVEVYNNGRQAVSFDVELRLNGNVEIRSEHTGELGSGKSANMTLPLQVLAEHINSPMDVEIEIIPRGWTDEVPADNISRFSLTAIQPEKPLVTDLKAEMTSDGISLSWSAPSLTPEPVTDSFGEYESFAYENFGDYKTVDRDGLIPCGIQGVEFPNMGTPMAFQIWEPRAAGVDVDAEIWQPRSGNKCLVAWTALSSYVDPFNDDWLISPALHLSDSPQELSFYVRRPVGTYGAESFEVLYSTTGDEPEDFILLKSETISNGSWNECRYTLPAGSRYFAIRYISENRFALLFDDLTYTRESERGNMRIEGFNVYRNGIKTGECTPGNCVFTDNDGNQSAYYNVSVVYDRGESGMSNTARLTSGTDDVFSPYAVSITGHKGYIAVEAPSGTEVSVVSTDGITVWQGETSGRIELPSGVYVATAGSRTFKVVVR